MAITLELPADLLADLNAEAAHTGEPPETIAAIALRRYFAVGDDAPPTFGDPTPENETPEQIQARFADDLAWEIAWWSSLGDSEREYYNERENRAFEAAAAQVAEGRRGRTTQEVKERIRARYAAEYGRK